jgi:hypothetical protein
MRLHSPIFFGCDPCGTGNGGSGSGQNDAPIVAGPGGALVCDNRYLTLAQGARMRLLGVTLGSNCQTFLSGPFAGFVFYGADGQAFVENQPKLSIPAINPAVSGVFPQPPPFQYLQIANGADPSVWYFLAAPSAGEKVLTAENGQWILKDPGTAAAQTAVCNTDGAVTKGNIVVCKKTGTDGDGNSIYGLRKLGVVQDHILVGNIDGTTGEIGYQAIDDASPVKHTLSKFVLARSATFKQFDAVTGADEAGGMAQQIVFGAVAPATNTTDALGVCYSPSTSKFYTRPPHVRQHLTVDADVNVADNGSWVSMGGHCLFPNLTFNYTAFYFSTTIRIRSSGTTLPYNNVLFGLFIDGILVNTWDTKNGQDIALSWIHTALAPGVHTVEVKFQQAAGTDGQMQIKFSTSCLFTFEE